MVYLVQGNAQQIFNAFGQKWVVRKEADTISRDIIELDLPRTKFLGTEQQAADFIQIWRSSAEVAYFTQGNISAANLFLLLGAPFKPFLKEDEDLAEYNAQFVRQDFAYMSEQNEPCGLMLIYRRDEPSKWLFGLMKNNHLAPKDRTVVLLSSVDLKPYIKSADSEVQPSTVDPDNNSLLSQINSPFIQNQLKNVIKPDSGEIDINFSGLEALSCFLKVNKSKGLYLKSNPARELTIKYNLIITPNILRNLLVENSGLRKELEAVVLGNDERFNKNLLQMVVVFYEEKTLEQNRTLLHNDKLIRAMGALMWDPAQIKLLPLLVDKKYDLDLMQLILSKEEYYRSFEVLVQLGLTQDVPVFFAIPAKLNQLNFINSLADEQCRTLCLIFWIKGNFSVSELEEIVKATEKYPMLARTLIALDQTKSIISIKDLKKHALNPLIHLQKSILYFYKQQFDAYGLKRSDLTQLNLAELNELNSSFSLLKQTGIDIPDAYRLALRKNNQGQILRLFLPGLSQIENIDHRKVLIDLLSKGIQKGVVSQGKALLEIKDKDLSTTALELRKRFICVKQMQDLRFTKEVIALAGEQGSIAATRFRQVIFKVEEQCKGVHERLRKSSFDRDKVGKWQRADEEYRRTLYSIAYEGITHPGVDLLPKINQAEAKILNIVDPEIKSWLQKVLVVIANILITILSVGVANDIKERKTGNYWFFNQTSSGEKLRALDKEVMSLIECPDSEIALLN